MRPVNLAARRRDQKKLLPPACESRMLGTSKRDRNGDYVGAIRVGRRQVELLLECGFEDLRKFPDGPEGAARVAEVCLQKPAKCAQNATALAADELLETKNTRWLEPGERPTSRTSFVKKLRLVRITVHRDGGALWFDDGMMFMGHVIVVGLDARGRLKDASLAG